ncbi:hypothetical protein NMY22_g19792 [Coprinellus aureogranulatus]|nr:hypothetical protein NMY22_g19792 [Coprinellus aureogranulatus]
MADPRPPVLDAPSGLDHVKSKAMFNTGENVLCCNGPVIYEAKILKVQRMDEPSAATGLPGWHYFVHYKGWKGRWDEWVQESRVIKRDEGGLRLQRSLEERYSAAVSHRTTSRPTKAMRVQSALKTMDRRGVGDNNTSGADDTRLAGDNAGTQPDVTLSVPDLLKRKLVEDWEWVSLGLRIAPVPREPNVETILQDFQAYILKTKPSTLQDPELLIDVFIAGLLGTFNTVVGSSLLYGLERKQYADMRRKYRMGQDVLVDSAEREMSTIYGAEHLLRMLVILPGMFPGLEYESMMIVRDYVNELLQYMWKKSGKLFVQDYRPEEPFIPSHPHVFPG